MARINKQLLIISLMPFIAYQSAIMRMFLHGRYTEIGAVAVYILLLGLISLGPSYFCIRLDQGDDIMDAIFPNMRSFTSHPGLWLFHFLNIVNYLASFAFLITSMQDETQILKY